MIWKEPDSAGINHLAALSPKAIPAVKFPSADFRGEPLLRPISPNENQGLMLNVLGYHVPNRILQNSILKDINNHVMKKGSVLK